MKKMMPAMRHCGRDSMSVLPTPARWSSRRLPFRPMCIGGGARSLSRQEGKMNSSATELSNALASAVEQASGSVVRVVARRHVASTGIAWSNDVVVTASHSIHHDAIHVDDVDATLAGIDEVNDVAVLRIGGANLTPIAWSDSQPRAGEIVIAAGRAG